MSDGENRVEELTSKLGFEIVDNETTLGEMQGIPTAMTVLDVEPLA